MYWVRLYWALDSDWGIKELMSMTKTSAMDNFEGSTDPLLQEHYHRHDPLTNEIILYLTVLSWFIQAAVQVP